MRKTFWNPALLATLFLQAPPAAGNWVVTVFVARPGYLLDPADHRPALDLIGDVPWLNPSTDRLESPVARSVSDVYPTINFNDPDAMGQEGKFPGPFPFPAGSPDVDDDHFAVLAEALLRIPQAGPYSFIAGHDDTFELTIDGNTVDVDGRRAAGVCCSPDRPVMTFNLRAGDLPIRLTYGEATGGAGLALFAAPGSGVEYADGSLYRLVGDRAGGGLDVVDPRPCDDAPEKAVIGGAPDHPVEAGTVVDLDGGGSTNGGGAGALTFVWEVVSGPGEIQGAADAVAAQVKGLAQGDVAVKLTVDDGVCQNPGTAQVVIPVRYVLPQNWAVTYYKPQPGYLLDPSSHQPVLDLIADLPWRNPASGQLESPIAYLVKGQYALIDFEDPDSPGDGGRFEPSEPFPEDVPEQDEDNFALLVSGIIRVPVRSFYSFIVGHDDTFQLTVNGDSVDALDHPATGTCCDDTRPVFTFDLPEGDVPLTLSYGAAGGGAYLELFAAGGFDVPFHDDGHYRRVGDVPRGGLEVVLGEEGGHWLRGDSNGDRLLDISDPTFTLAYLFLGGARSGCGEALDLNQDGRLDLSDAVAMLSILFLGGSIPGGWGTCEAFPTCGSSCP